MQHASRSHDNTFATATMTASDRSSEPAGGAPKPLSPQAERALREAAERRAATDARTRDLAGQTEHQGRGGLEPVRYDDWEVKGLASDF